MKQILLIGTGGTIASKESENGLVPAISADEILSFIPEVRDLCRITAYQLFNLDSTNMTPENWIGIADFIKDNYEIYDGFVITHGTDTMSYSVAALSYLIQNSRKPIVFTGSQKSIYERDSDARNNLLNAFIFASDDDAFGVRLVFDNKILIGTRTRKTHTKSFNAFESIDYPSVGIFRDHRIIYYIKEEKPKGDVRFFSSLNSNIFLLKLIPGLDEKIFGYIRENYDGVVIESFGVGGVPSYPSENYSKEIEKMIRKGITIIMATQVPYEGSDIELYQVGYHLKERFDLLEASTMTLETSVVKLMWVLAQTRDKDEIRRLFYTPIDKDILI